MIQLNLLPNSTKQRIAREINKIELINNIIIISLFLLISSVLLFSSQQYVKYKINEIDISKNSTNVNSTVGQINKSISQINDIQQDYIKWSQILQEFLVLVPKNNQLHSLILDKDDKKLSLSGFAKTRDDFLSFKNNLDKWDLIKSINSPISNLLYQNDIDFRLDAELNF